MDKREEEFLDEQDERKEYDDMQMRYDLEPQRSYASDMMPQDFYQYKKIIIIPESQTDFSGLLDKDVVLANLKAGDIEEHAFQVGTIQACKDIFVQPRTVVNLKADMREPVFEEQLIFDEAFRPVINILLAQFKYQHVSTRALGDTRASILDTMTTSRIMKEFTKKKKNKDTAFGVG